MRYEDFIGEWFENIPYDSLVFEVVVEQATYDYRKLLKECHHIHTIIRPEKYGELKANLDVTNERVIAIKDLGTKQEFLSCDSNLKEALKCHLA